MTTLDWRSFAMKSSSPMTPTIGLLLFLLFAASDSVRAQQSDSPRNPLTINTDLVVTWAQVLDRKDGKVVNGLEIDDFVLREDGKPQQISMIKEGQPLSVVMLVEGLACSIEPPEFLSREDGVAPGFALPRRLVQKRSLNDDHRGGRRRIRPSGRGDLSGREVS
jgi:hypothetical protein